MIVSCFEGSSFKSLHLFRTHTVYKLYRKICNIQTVDYTEICKYQRHNFSNQNGKDEFSPKKATTLYELPVWSDTPCQQPMKVERVWCSTAVEIAKTMDSKDIHKCKISGSSIISLRFAYLCIIHHGYHGASVLICSRGY